MLRLRAHTGLPQWGSWQLSGRNVLSLTGLGLEGQTPPSSGTQCSLGQTGHLSRGLAVCAWTGLLCGEGPGIRSGSGEELSVFFSLWEPVGLSIPPLHLFSATLMFQAACIHTDRDFIIANCSNRFSRILERRACGCLLAVIYMHY